LANYGEGLLPVPVVPEVTLPVTSNLIFWLDPNYSGNTQSVGKFAEIPNRDGGNSIAFTNASDSTRPLVSTVEDRTAVDFAASTTFLSTDSSIPDSIHQDGLFTFAGIFYTMTAGVLSILGSTDGNSFQRGININIGISHAQVTISDAQLSPYALSVGDFSLSELSNGAIPHIVVVYGDNSNAHIRVDGVEVVTGAYTRALSNSNPATGDLYLGSHPNESAGINSEIGDIVLYSAELSIPDIESIESWMADRAGITI
jgi:hypothetical protein